LLPQLTGMADQGTGHRRCTRRHLQVRGDHIFERCQRRLSAFPASCAKSIPPGAFLAFCLIIATIPVVIFGVIPNSIDDMMRNITVIGWTMLIFGLIGRIKP
jgi:undecaprenyl-diphosphatase